MLITSQSHFFSFDREQWSRYQHGHPLTLSEDQITALHGQVERVSRQEVEAIYLPLSTLLQYRVTAMRQQHADMEHFLGGSLVRLPFVIGVTGSVAVGKSTASRVLNAVLSLWPDAPTVSVITTDGFLYPNAVLQQQGLMQRKGFPESYHTAALIQILTALKSGVAQVQVPTYSHHSYDIVEGCYQTIAQSDIVIVEGLNVLQLPRQVSGGVPATCVSDFLDFSIYVDAELSSIQQWYIDRVLGFCQGAFCAPESYFHFLTALNVEEQMKFATRVWHEINEVNLIDNILPVKWRSDLILHKSADHSVDAVLLRRR